MRAPQVGWILTSPEAVQIAHDAAFCPLSPDFSAALLQSMRRLNCEPGHGERSASPLVSQVAYAFQRVVSGAGATFP